MNKGLLAFKQATDGLERKPYSPSQFLSGAMPEQQDMATFMTDEEKAKVAKFLASEIMAPNAPAPDDAVNTRLKIMGIK